MSETENLVNSALLIGSLTGIKSLRELYDLIDELMIKYNAKDLEELNAILEKIIEN